MPSASHLKRQKMRKKPSSARFFQIELEGHPVDPGEAWSVRYGGRGRAGSGYFVKPLQIQQKARKLLLGENIKVMNLVRSLDLSLHTSTCLVEKYCGWKEAWGPRLSWRLCL